MLLNRQLAGMLAQYRANTKAAGTQVWSNGNGGTMWRAPPTGFMKINFDGAVFDDANMSGVGVVIRDCYGEVLAYCSDKISHAYEAEVTEALAAQKALSFAQELGFQNVILEGDELGLIQALKSQEQNLCPLGLLVEDVKIYSSHFQRVLYSHVKRNNNSVTHNLVRHAISIPDCQICMEDVPPHIVLVLHSDVTHLH